MAQNNDGIWVSIGVDTSRFQRDLKKADAQAEQLRKKVERPMELNTNNSKINNLGNDISKSINDGLKNTSFAPLAAAISTMTISIVGSIKQAVGELGAVITSNFDMQAELTEIKTVNGELKTAKKELDDIKYVLDVISNTHPQNDTDTADKAAWLDEYGKKLEAAEIKVKKLQAELDNLSLDWQDDRDTVSGVITRNLQEAKELPSQIKQCEGAYAGMAEASNVAVAPMQKAKDAAKEMAGAVKETVDGEEKISVLEEGLITRLARRIGLHEQMMKDIRQQISSVEGLKEIGAMLWTDVKKILSMISGFLKSIGNIIKGLSTKVKVLLGVAAAILIIIKVIIEYVKQWIKNAKEVFSIFSKLPEVLINGVKKGLELIKKMLDGIKIDYNKALEAVYSWNDGNTLIHKSLDSISSDVAAISSGLVAMASPILNVLAPIFDILTDKILLLMNAIAKLFAMLGGQTSYQKAIKGAKQYKDATDAAAKSQDNFTAGIDELNVLSENSGGSSSSSGGSGYDYITEEITHIDISGAINSLLQKIRIEADKLPDIGKEIGTWLYTTFRDISPTELGKTIGTLITDTFATLKNITNPFAKNKDKVKEWICETIASALKAIKAKDITDLVNNLIDIAQGILDGIREGMKKGNFKGLIKEIADGINWKDICELITTWGELKHYIATTVLEGFLEGWSQGLHAVATDNGSSYGYAGENTTKKDGYAFGPGVNGNDSAAAKKEAEDAYSNAHQYEEDYTINWVAIYNAQAAKAESEKVQKVWSDFWDWMTGKNQEGVENIHKDTAETNEANKQTWESFKQDISTIGQWFTDTFTIDWSFGNDAIKKDTTGLQTDGSQAWENFKTSINTIGQWFKETFTIDWGKAHDTVKEKVESVLTAIQQKWSNMKANIIAFVSDIKQTVSNHFTSMAVNIKSSLNSIIVHFNNWGRSLVQVINKVASAWAEFTDMSDGAYGKDGEIHYSGNQGKWTPISWSDINYLATGGIVNTGSLFVAGEAGPELVGAFGNQSAVMNSDQIVEAVSAGVYAAVKSAMGNGQSVNVYLDGKQIESSVRNTAQSRGANIAVGGVLNYSYA